MDETDWLFHPYVTLTGENFTILTVRVSDELYITFFAASYKAAYALASRLDAGRSGKPCVRSANTVSSSPATVWA
jgi:hypothetical protein